ncbi:hypothetical protein IV203_001861 [Nitzschia inconspicua]|uniref:Uncharacterized protein n=1 Tax=Nitzschia inconspicua TaxID=303405 RepID=A0A9K3L863_9STRA|nr:hypothetical protein IV203_001861 [Nitzschia inconspicua]
MDGLRSSSSDADKEAHDCIISTTANFSLQLRDFVSCLEDQRIRLGHKLSEAEVENIDEQFRKLRLTFKEQIGFSQMLLDAQASCAVQLLEKCWSQLGSGFEQLRMFCGAIASIMPSTSSVESDFSLINWTKDPIPTCKA